MIEDVLIGVVPTIMVLTPIVVGLVEVLKQAKDIESRYAPLASLVIGLVLSVGSAVLLGQELATSVIVGLIAGLSASGLYDVSSLRK